MKMHIILLVCAAMLVSMPCSAKRSKKEKDPKPTYMEQMNEAADKEDKKESHPYHPNPVILAGVGQIMNGALSIAQDPHSRPNLGHSIAHMIHGIMTIIVEKLAHKQIVIDDQEDMQEYFNELCAGISKEIIEAIVAKTLVMQDHCNIQ